MSNAGMFVRAGFVRSLASAVLAGAVGAGAGADVVEIVGFVPGSTEGLGSFSGFVEYVPDGGTTGTLTVTLTNTTDPATGGFLTGFLFDVQSADPDAKVMLASSADYPLFTAASGSGAPFGSFDAGAALGGKFLGGGSPNGGIPVGMTGTFVFTVMAADAAMLQAGDFVMGAPGAYEFVVRFKGMCCGGSDKVPGIVTCPADLNGDGVVDELDLNLILAWWGTSNPAGDVNGDGIVDVEDLKEWLFGYGPCYPE